MKIAKERAKIRQLDNIVWINDWIENIPQLGLGKFDFIECGGALHHLKDPLAGKCFYIDDVQCHLRQNLETTNHKSACGPTG